MTRLFFLIFLLYTVSALGATDSIELDTRSKLYDSCSILKEEQRQYQRIIDQLNAALDRDLEAGKVSDATNKLKQQRQNFDVQSMQHEISCNGAIKMYSDLLEQTVVITIHDINVPILPPPQYHGSLRCRYSDIDNTVTVHCD